MSSPSQSTAPPADVAEWDTMYDELVQFHQKHGHCRIPHHNLNLRKLYYWVSYQRRNSAMSQQRRARLEALDYDWTSQLNQKRERRWNEMFERLEAYKDKHGDCLVPAAFNDHQLVAWVKNQRFDYWWAKMPDEQVRRLESLGFDWDPGVPTVQSEGGGQRSGSPPAAPTRGQTSWDVMYEKLARYYEINGSCNVGQSRSADLHNWILEQRVANANNKLSAGKRLKLDQIHFSWMSHEEKQEEFWNDMFESLEAYKAANGDCVVPNSYCDDRKLYNWVIWQRRVNKEGKLPQHRRDRLHGIGFCWDASKASDESSASQRRDPAPAQEIVPAPAAAAGGQTSWDVMYEKLARHYRTNGTCNVAPSLSADLHNWILEQRVANANNKLSAGKGLKLDQIHFSWVSHEEKQEECWNDMFESLEAYKAANGDCLVPHSYCEDRKLYNWVIWQRRVNKEGKLPQHRRDRLHGIGFCWDASKASDESSASKRRGPAPDIIIAPAAAAGGQLSWDVMYEKLARHYRTNGNCHISISMSDDLYDWILEQRVANANNELSAGKRLKLDQIHFSWMSRDEKHVEAWNEMFESLKVYKAANGDCLVPTSYCENPKLANWVKWQRSVNKTGKLPGHRRDRLQVIGFCWDTSKTSADTSQSRGRNPAPAKDIVLAPAAAAAGGQTSWGVMYKKLVRYYRTNGYCSVSQSTSVHLHNWILEQRVANANNELSAGKRLKLDQIHFPWVGQGDKQEEAWNKMFESLEAHKAANGDCLVPEADQEDPKLYNWVKWQRHVNKKGKMPRHRRDRLQGIGFCWDVKLMSNEMKQALTLAVPASQLNPSAGDGTSDVLPSRNGQQPHQDARSLMLQKQWDEMFERFKAFVAVNGDYVALYVDDRQLCDWVYKQRYNYKRGKLLQHRREKLESIGFTWDARKAKIPLPNEPRVTAVSAMKNDSPTVVGQRWNLQLERLKIYQAWHDNCSVPTSYDKELAEWVSCQHYLHKINKLREPRYGKLERIGFFSDAQAETSFNGGTKRGASTRATLESEDQSFAGAQDLPDGTNNPGSANPERGADLARSPKRSRMDDGFAA